MTTSREYPAYPIPCAAAIVMEGESVLLIQRGREPNYGQWSFPGGAVEVGESSRECAAREVLEETGLQVEIRDVVEVVDRVFRDASGAIQYHYLIVDYLATLRRGDLQPASDVLAARWVPFAEALEFDLAPPTSDVLRKAIDLWRMRQNSAEFA